MRSKVRIYLSGSIKKGRLDERAKGEFWTALEEEKIRRLVRAETTLLNPAKSPISRGDYFSNYGCDLYLVSQSDVVLVDLRAEKGLGVGAEMMFAQFIQRPVIGWLPHNSYYKRDKIEDVYGEDLSDWTHPFVYGLCDLLADDLEQACEYINRICLDGQFKKDNSKSPDQAIAAFRRAYRDKWNP